jgi:dual specificity protein kinase YAK1
LGKLLFGLLFVVLISYERMPPSYMMDLGKQTGHFFDSYTDAFGHKKYRLKSIEQYARERNANEQPGKQYFKATTLPDIINQAPMPNFKSSRHGTEMEKGGGGLLQEKHG